MVVGFSDEGGAAGGCGTVFLSGAFAQGLLAVCGGGGLGGVGSSVPLDADAVGSALGFGLVGTGAALGGAGATKSTGDAEVALVARWLAPPWAPSATTTGSASTAPSTTRPTTKAAEFGEIGCDLSSFGVVGVT